MSLSRSTGRALGLLLGFTADAIVGDPRRGHPVAGFGRLASALEQRTYADRRRPGIAHVALLVGAVTTGGVVLEAAGRRSAWVQVIGTAAATWAVLGGRSLVGEADQIGAQLVAGDLASARRQIRNLVGRDPSELGAEEIARACVESVAENTSDAVVAPLLWGAVAGVPGLIGYRAVNTLDAMVGHRSPRYERFGWAAARLDDVANWVPARVAGGLAAIAAPFVRGKAADALRAVRNDAHRHPSPNAGVVEAAFAGALDVRLGGVNVYHGQPEDRGTLGDGAPVRVGDISRAARLSRWVAVGALAAAVSAAALSPRLLWPIRH